MTTREPRRNALTRLTHTWWPTCAAEPARSRLFTSELFRTILPVALALYLLGAYLLFIKAALLFMTQFPSSYTWTDWMINFQGGFVRRGLIGELAYQLDGVVSARYAIGILVLVLYLVVTTAVAVKLSRQLTFASILFLISPAGLLFPLYDVLAFGRKDILVFAGFCIAIFVIDSTDPTRASVVIGALYLLIGLVTETAWFYFPLAIATLLIRSPSVTSTRSAVLIAASATAFMCLGLIVAAWLGAGTQAHTAAIVRSWRLIYPDAYRDEIGEMGAVRWFGLSIPDGIGMMAHHQNNTITITGYLIAFSLAGLPLGLRLIAHPLRGINRVGIAALVTAIAVMFCSFAMAADWGRFISLFLLHGFIAMIAIDKSQNVRQSDRFWGQSDAYGFAIKIALLVLYGATWKLRHFAPRGESPLIPGILFGLMP